MNTTIEIEPGQLKEMKDKTLKCKIIVLDEMGRDPLLNPKYLSKSDKNKLIMKVKEYLLLPNDEIDEKFNSVCNDKLFVCGKDLEYYPCYCDPRDESQKELYDKGAQDIEKLKEEIKKHQSIQETSDEEVAIKNV